MKKEPQTLGEILGGLIWWFRPDNVAEWAPVATFLLGLLIGFRVSL